MEGYLLKQSDWLKSWNKRYCRVAEGCLLYFEDEMDKHPKGRMSLSECAVSLSQSNPDVFVVTTSRNKAFQFRCESEIAREIWYDTLVRESVIVSHPRIHQGKASNSIVKMSVPRQTAVHSLNKSSSSSAHTFTPTSHRSSTFQSFPSTSVDQDDTISELNLDTFDDRALYHHLHHGFPDARNSNNDDDVYDDDDGVSSFFLQKSLDGGASVRSDRSLSFSIHENDPVEPRFRRNGGGTVDLTREHAPAIRHGRPRRASSALLSFKVEPEAEAVEPTPATRGGADATSFVSPKPAFVNPKPTLAAKVFGPEQITPNTKTFVFLGGYPCDFRSWTHVVERLKAGHRCIVTCPPGLDTSEEDFTRSTLFRRDGNSKSPKLLDHVDVSNMLANTISLYCRDGETVVLVTEGFGSYWGLNVVKNNAGVVSRCLILDCDDAQQRDLLLCTMGDTRHESTRDGWSLVGEVLAWVQWAVSALSSILFLLLVYPREVFLAAVFWVGATFGGLLGGLALTVFLVVWHWFPVRQYSLSKWCLPRSSFGVQWHMGYLYYNAVLQFIRNASFSGPEASGSKTILLPKECKIQVVQTKHVGVGARKQSQGGRLLEQVADVITVDLAGNKNAAHFQHLLAHELDKD